MGDRLGERSDHERSELSGLEQSEADPKQEELAPTDLAAQTAKASYEPPRILSREPLEAIAAECSSIPTGKTTAVCTVAFS